MQSAELLINVRRTSKGGPNDSFTVHRNFCCARAKRFYDPDSKRWAWTTLDRLELLKSDILFGACGHCWDNKSKMDASWAIDKEQMRSDEAKRILTEGIKPPDRCKGGEIRP